MRRVYIAISLLGFIVFLCIYSNIKLNEYTDDMVNLLEKAEYYAIAGDDEKLIDIATEAEKIWQESSKFIGLVTRHNEMDEVAKRLTFLKFLAQNGDLEQYLEQSSLAKSLVEHIAEMEMPYLKNIF